MKNYSDGGDIMLTMIKGAFNSERDKVFCDAVRDAVSKNKSVLVIMPDQYSFECDKKLYRALGAAAFNSIETAGINRLAELISKKYGCCAYENADENIRLITMFKAVEKFRASGECMHYKRSLGKSRFIAEVIGLVTELIRSGITPEDLRIASERLSGSLTKKLYDISRIYALYLEELKTAGRRDSLTALADALVLVKEHRYFAGMSVFIDGFTDFSHDELDMINAMLAQHADVTVSLIGYSDPKGNVIENTFAATVRTCSRLIDIAKSNNTIFKEIELRNICGAGKTALAIDRYYCTGEKSDKKKLGGLVIASANDVYDETEYVCAEIERLVRSGRYSYGNIAVAARDLSICASAAEAAFDRYGIPFFTDRRNRADSSIVVIFLKSLFECILPQRYHTDDIMRYVKSPLFPLNEIEITNLEDHCITYNIDGDMWLEPFGSHDKKHNVPSNLEDIRKKIIEPLEAFKAACIEATGAKICEALFELLKEIKFSEQVYSVVKRSVGEENETQLEFVRANRQIWQLVFGAFKTIHDELGDEIVPLKKFYELFKLMTSGMSISSPPQKLDAVRLVNAESSRLDNVDVLFVIEMNERIFPADPVGGGLFTESEKQQLISTDIAVSGTALQSAENERLVAYRTLCLPKKRLYALYSETDTAGKSRRRSLLIDTLSGIFGGADVLYISKLPISFFCSSYKSAYYKYLEHYKEKLAVISKQAESTAEGEAQAATLRRNADTVSSVEKALEGSDEYASRIAALPGYEYDQSFTVSPKTAKELFYPEKLILSPTSMNYFFTCPFSYYCQYGLKLRDPQSIKFDKMTKGNYLHHCLEMLMSSEKDGKKVYNKSFVCYTDEQLKEKIAQAFYIYETEEIGGEYGKTPSFAAEREKYQQSVFETVKLIREEFSNCQFEPSFFEYKLTRENGESLLELKFSDELTIRVVGSIDRADIFTDTDGKKYIRIIDYKTGMTTLELDKLYHGLNMQLLVYLLALTGEIENAFPAAVLYSHIKEPDSKLLPPAPGTDADTYSLRLKEYKPDGMMSGQENVINAFNRDHNGIFMPITLKNDGTVSGNGQQPVTEAFLKASEEFARRKILSLAERLSKGLIPADPVMKGKYNPCTGCEHYAICGRVLHGDPRQITKEDADRFKKDVEKISEEQKGGESDASME